MFTASQLFFYMKTEQLHISLYFGVQDSLLFLHVSFFPCRAIKNSLSKKPEIFLGARSQKNENFNTAHGFAKSNFLLESNWIFFFFLIKNLAIHISVVYYILILTFHTSPLLLLTLFGKAALHQLFSDWDSLLHIYGVKSMCITSAVSYKPKENFKIPLINFRRKGKTMSVMSNLNSRD